MKNQNSTSAAMYEMFVASKETQLFNAIDDCNVARVNELIIQGVRSDTRRSNKTPLLYALSRAYERYQIIPILHALFGHPDLFNVFINAQDADGKTALILSASTGNVSVVNFLLSYEGIDLNHKSKSGHTALMAAAMYGYKDVVSLLLNQENMDLNATNNKGNTALMCAIITGCSNIAILLLDQKEIDVNVKNTHGHTALQLAENRSAEHIAILLRKNYPLNQFSDQFSAREAQLLTVFSRLEVSYTLLNTFYCPINHELLSDPVFMSDGYYYDKKCMIECFRRNDFRDISSPQKPNVRLKYQEVKYPNKLHIEYILRLIDEALTTLEQKMQCKLKADSGAKMDESADEKTLAPVLELGLFSKTGASSQLKSSVDSSEEEFDSVENGGHATKPELFAQTSA